MNTWLIITHLPGNDSLEFIHNVPFEKEEDIEQFLKDTHFADEGMPHYWVLPEPTEDAEEPYNHFMYTRGMDNKETVIRMY